MRIGVQIPDLFGEAVEMETGVSTGKVVPGLDLSG